MKEKSSVARERLSAFFDPATFVELGAFIRRPGNENETEGVVCGYGAVDGRLVFAFAQDESAMKGAVDGRHAEKIAKLYDKALSVGAPVVGMLDSAGAVVFDGAAALSGYGVLLDTVAAASGVVPQLALVHGKCTGTMAAVAALFDFTVVTKGAALYVCGEGSAEEAYATGNAALLCENEAEAMLRLRTLLSYLPDDYAATADLGSTGDDPNRAVSLSDRVTAKEALAVVADKGSAQALFEGYAPEVQTGFATMGDLPVAYLAVDGKLTGCGIEKMTKMLRFADAFAIPLVTFLNCEGIDGAAAADSATAKALARLARAESACDTARVTAIVGAAVGAGFIFGGSKTLGADVVLSLPAAEISAITATTAVAFLENDRITKELDRKTLENEWRQQNATALAAASVGEVDDIVDPTELRARMIAALYMLEGKNGRAPRFC